MMNSILPFIARTISAMPQTLPQAQPLNQWVSLKMRPTSLGSNKNKPGKKYAK